MPYIPPKRGKHGKYTGLGPNPDEISIQQQKQINKRATHAECTFRTEIAAKLYRRTGQRIRFKFQHEFIVATGITFIVDFYFPKLKLVVELDGKNHYTEYGVAKDKWRSDLLSEYMGISTLHFENSTMLQTPEDVWNSVLDTAIAGNGTPSYRRYLKMLREKGLLPYRWKQE